MPPALRQWVGEVRKVLSRVHSRQVSRPFLPLGWIKQHSKCYTAIALSGLPARLSAGGSGRRSPLSPLCKFLTVIAGATHGRRTPACHASPSPWALGPPLSQASPQALRFRQNPFISNMGRGAAQRPIVRGRNFFLHSLAATREMGPK